MIHEILGRNILNPCLWLIQWWGKNMMLGIIQNWPFKNKEDCSEEVLRPQAPVTEMVNVLLKLRRW